MTEHQYRLYLVLQAEAAYLKDQQQLYASWFPPDGYFFDPATIETTWNLDNEDQLLLILENHLLKLD